MRAGRRPGARPRPARRRPRRLPDGTAGLFSELGHVAQDRDPPPRSGSFHEIREGRAHRDRVRVVRVVDQKATARELVLFPTPACEVDLDGFRPRQAQRVENSQRRRCVLHLVASGEVEADTADDRATVDALRGRLRRFSRRRCRRARPGSRSGRSPSHPAEALRSTPPSPGQRLRVSRRARDAPARRSSPPRSRGGRSRRARRSGRSPASRARECRPRCLRRAGRASAARRSRCCSWPRRRSSSLSACRGRPGCPSSRFCPSTL